MEPDRQTKNQHLLWRTGFGPGTGDFGLLQDIHPHKLYKKIEKAAAVKPVPFEAVNLYIKSALLMPESPAEEKMDKEEKKKFTAEQRRIINQNSKTDINNLTLQWVNQMVNSPAQLREKLSLFWHGHFASRINNSLYQQQLINEIRANAFENFGDLLKKVSKSASMLSFLNNQQNKKKKPNENFAREVMELFTLGRGNYTEQDVKEAARAFTGWTYEKDGRFAFNPKTHDDGEKTVLGTTGKLNGDDVLDIILKQPQTAKYITTKLYRFFVNEQIDDAKVQWLANRFYKNNYDIRQLMHDLFTSDWFYDPQHIGCKIKSPVEYIAGIRRLLPMTIRNEQVQVLIHRILGQWLFNPPNVAGWPGGTAWIDSSSLMLRLRIPALIKDDGTLNLKPKGNDDIEMGRKETIEVAAGKNGKPKKPGSGYQIVAQIDWPKFEQALGKIKQEALFDQLESLILQVPLQTGVKSEVEKKSRQNKDSYTRALTIALMGTPEYQLS